MAKRYPITLMAAACVPWDEQFNFQEDIFRREVRSMVDANIKSIYIFGTAGEGFAVSDGMFETIARVFWDEMKAPGLMPMVCVISVSLQQILHRIERCHEIGFRDFQLAFPPWGALRDSEVDNYFRAVCDRFNDCRFMHYNNGNRSRRKLTIRDYTRLALNHPNLVAVKYSTMDLYEIEGIMNTDCPLAFYFVDNGYTFGSMFGECGFLNSFASVDFGLSWKHFEAGRTKDYKTLLKMESYLFALTRAFSEAPDDRIDAAYDKSIERVNLPELSQRLYPPYEGISDEDFEKVKEKMLRTVEKYQSM